MSHTCSSAGHGHTRTRGHTHTCAHAHVGKLPKQRRIGEIVSLLRIKSQHHPTAFFPKSYYFPKTALFLLVSCVPSLLQVTATFSSYSYSIQSQTFSLKFIPKSKFSNLPLSWILVSGLLEYTRKVIKRFGVFFSIRNPLAHLVIALEFTFQTHLNFLVSGLPILCWEQV